MAYTGEAPANLSITSHFVACTLNATSDDLYLPMQNGRTLQNISLPADPQSDPWTVWSPGPTTNLTQIVCKLVTLWTLLADEYHVYSSTLLRMDLILRPYF